MTGPVPLTFDILAVLQSDLARQSLYVKFDPLVEARSDQVEQGVCTHKILFLLNKTWCI